MGTARGPQLPQSAISDQVRKALTVEARMVACAFRWLVFEAIPAWWISPEWSGSGTRVRAVAGPLVRLAEGQVRDQAHEMFTVDEAAAEAIRRAYEESGELAGVVELRRHFPLITDNVNAVRCVRVIAGWKPIVPKAPMPARKALRRRSVERAP